VTLSKSSRPPVSKARERINAKSGDRRASVPFGGAAGEKKNLIPKATRIPAAAAAGRLAKNKLLLPLSSRRARSSSAVVRRRRELKGRKYSAPPPPFSLGTSICPPRVYLYPRPRVRRPCPLLPSLSFLLSLQQQPGPGVTSSPRCAVCPRRVKASLGLGWECGTRPDTRTSGLDTRDTCAPRSL
jgi:hypothetical protein